ncbi:DUF4173 domain-containing protein [Candidatus Peregrinibacteria bacterium]|nr:MAG: DUF4173 domain-containing protein [Candidatus Peregrinibacteria bacterium]
MNDEKNSIKKASAILSISLFLGICFRFFFYEKILGISFPLYIMLIVAGLFSLFALLGRRIRKQVLWLFLPLFFLSGMVFVRANELLTFLNIVATVLILLIIAEEIVGKKTRHFLFGDYLKTLFVPFQFLRPFLQTLFSFLSFGRKNFDDRREVSIQIIKGVSIAAPILFLFLVLFSSADLVFQQYLTGVLRFNIAPEFFVQLFLVVFVSCFFIGAYSYVFQKQKDHVSKGTQSKHHLGHIESAIILGSVNALFSLFLLVQCTYFFGGENNISIQGFTYAEYARRGFFELIAVAVFSLLLLLSTERYILRKNRSHVLHFKVLSTVLIFQIIVIMISAFLRLSLYESAYGFTTLRLYSHAFIILLAVIFCLLLFKIYRDAEGKVFVFQIFLSSILFLVAMNMGNPDAFIAQKNIERFFKTQDLDISYLTSLSNDAIPEMISVFDMLDEDKKHELALFFRQQLREKNISSFSSWQSFHISRLRSEQMLVSEKDKF